jgi:tRNA-binding EMAP/Myf-like protein
MLKSLSVVQMPAEGANADSCSGVSSNYHQALALIQSNELVKLKDLLASIHDSQIAEVDSCGMCLSRSI